VRLHRLILLVVAFAIAASGMAYAQATTGTITGVVQDESRGVIPNASITLTNDASLDVRRTVTNKEGLFNFSAVPLGSYSVLIEVQGFRPWKRTKVALGGGERINVADIRLATGALTEQVTVTEQIAMAPVDSGEKSTTITYEQIQNISVLGRSAAELVKILPGMVPSIGQWTNVSANNEARNVASFNGGVVGINGNGEGGGQSAVGTYSANGTRPEAMEIVIDGAHAADPGCNCATSVNPNPEMIAEMKVLQSNFTAENAKGPVALSIVSRSGGREFHGSLYTYHRNYKLNANEWALNRAGQKRPESVFTYPGGTLGGPLAIPGLGFNKNKDKAFFFLGIELFRQKIDTGVINSYVPTDRMKAGDFSNPADYAGLGTGSAGRYVSNRPTNLDANGRIPANLIDKNAQILMNLLPAPNADPAVNAGYNYVKAITSDQNGNQIFARVDVSMSDNTKAFVRYARQREIQPWAGGLWWRNGTQVPSPSRIIGKNRSDSVSATLTHVFNPKMTSETILGYTYINFPNDYEDPTKMSREALGYSYTGFLGAADKYIPNFGPGNNGTGPEIRNFGDFNAFFAKKQMFSVGENFTMLVGKHTVKAGFFYEWVNNAQAANANSNGAIALSPDSTNSSGNYFSDLLTGTIFNYNDAMPNPLANIAYKTTELYVQDSWKVTPKFTAEFGVRLQHMPGWYENQYGKGIPVWNQATFSASAPVANHSGLSWHGIDPNIPLNGVKRPFLVAAPRFGFAYDLSGKGDTVIRGGIGLFRFNEMQEFYTTAVSIALGQQAATTGGSGIMLRDVDNYLATHPISAAGRGDMNAALTAGDTALPGTTSWSLTLQKRLPWQMMLEASYVGNHLFNENDCSNACSSDRNTVAMGAMLNDPDGDANAYRPNQSYNAINAVLHRYYENYHSGQFMLSKQTGNFNMMAAYTFSKVLGFRRGNRGSVTGDVRLANGQLMDIRETNYGVLQNDRTHVLSFTYSWKLPTIQNNKALNAVVGGWQVTGISQFISGIPLQAITIGGNGSFGMQGTMADGQSITRTRITGSPAVAVQPVLTCDPRKGTTGDQMINPSCFSLPAIGSNGPYIEPHMTGQWYQNHDLSIFKNFALGGVKKIQLRASAYNVLNMAQRYPDPGNNLTLNFANGVVSNASQFGLLPKDNKYGHRTLQIGAKFLF
jgi:Carboxypeptidase regulatory-like domain